MWAGSTRRPAPGTQDPKYTSRLERCHRPSYYLPCVSCATTRASHRAPAGVWGAPDLNTELDSLHSGRGPGARLQKRSSCKLLGSSDRALAATSTMIANTGRRTVSVTCAVARRRGREPGSSRTVMNAHGRLRTSRDPRRERPGPPLRPISPCKARGMGRFSEGYA